MNVSFRTVEKRDMAVLRLTARDWQSILDRRRYGSFASVGGWGNLPARVVAIDGQVVLAFDANGQVCFQDDRFPIADLIRADLKVRSAALEVDRYALADLKRERSAKPSGFDLLADALRRTQA